MFTVLILLKSHWIILMNTILVGASSCQYKLDRGNKGGDQENMAEGWMFSVSNLAIGHAT